MGKVHGLAGSGGGLDLFEQCDRSVGPSKPGVGVGSRAQAADHDLRFLGSAGGGLKPVEYVCHPAALPSQDEDADLRGSDPDEVIHIAARLELRGQVADDVEGLIVLSGADQRVDQRGIEVADHPGEPSGLSEGDAVAHGFDGCGRAFEAQECFSKVVVEQGYPHALARPSVAITIAWR